MAGKSGLNLTKAEDITDFTAQFTDASDWFAPMLAQFGPTSVERFANSLGQNVFTGSSGRVFPEVMKASPMLRAWLEKLTKQNVEFRTKWRWTGWHEDRLMFDTPQGVTTMKTDAVVFALGGASWPKLGSDGAWHKGFIKKGIQLNQFGAANSAIRVEWSQYMKPHFGAALKAVAFSSGDFTSRGEAILTSQGFEGGGIYSVSRGVREGNALCIDLKPDWTFERVISAIEKPHCKASAANHLRRALKLSKLQLALLNEWERLKLDDARALAKRIKGLQIKGAQMGPIEDAISTSGGITKGALNKALMLHQMPGTFCAGEMLDWEAPTGGYLLTACFATGRVAGRGAAEFLGLTPAREPV